MANKYKRILLIGNCFSSNMDISQNTQYRSYKLQEAFAEYGVEVKLVLINYKNTKCYISEHKKLCVLSAHPSKWLKSRNLLRTFLATDKPDVYWFTNGPIVAFISMIFINIFKKKIIYEVLDNYSTYYPKILFPITLLDKYIRKSALLCIYVTAELAKLDKNKTTRRLVNINGYDPDIFTKMDKNVAREQLEIPAGVQVIGFAGSLDQRVNCNLEYLFESPKFKNCIFVVASNSTAPEFINKSNVLFLGKMEMNQIPLLINSADIMLIPNRHDEFTKFCFPSKLMEYEGCEANYIYTPMNKTVRKISSGYESSFDMSIFASDLEQLLNKPPALMKQNSKKFDWHYLVKRLQQRLERTS
ncbi:hypothetical protein Q4574_01140 [Aliiglaciecola sp. 3_MG-2023]|uniref:hypothetical protein n=1 Tax=Aliiglaciecola sp. 3_MG-2023 TaxID=3062644 RepID=UPI0026E281DB|nr:hypothetical protein [Aliiglaciecola sp. 3_MG-2023]MDO6691862.1 hypothetical protein [Aliiglaciecola sp. 3_MG-2023]